MERRAIFFGLKEGEKITMYKDNGRIYIKFEYPKDREWTSIEDEGPLDITVSADSAPNTIYPIFTATDS